MNAFLPLADIVKISDEELEFITGKTNIEEALPSLLQENTKCVVYTQWGKMVLQYIQKI